MRLCGCARARIELGVVRARARRLVLLHASAEEAELPIDALRADPAVGIHLAAPMNVRDLGGRAMADEDGAALLAEDEVGGARERVETAREQR
ncbi:MAG: hypothetical protein HYV07_14690 [Deltaproteobacteria bacterium]|nr:hypothetical protein [Deltaproteobacteria bacterium]